MDLRQLRAVVAIVDHGGFTRAAAALHVAQPSLSQTVRTLEAELGVELFHRTGRRVTLTAAGEALLEPARRALRDADTAREAAVAVAGLVAGHVDVVALPTLAVVPVAELVGRFRRAHPAVTVRLTEPEDPAALVAMLRDGRSELGFTELPLADDDLETLVLSDQRYDAVLPPGSSAPDAIAAAIPLQRLADLPLVTTPPGTSTRHLADDAFAGAGLRPTIAVETSHREVIVPLVLAGAGAALLPHELATDAAARGAEAHPVRPAITRRIGVAHRRGSLSPAARAFLELLP
jgi:LysR family transcriptional regulator, carnitine catabolism transcriptional activator